MRKVRFDKTESKKTATASCRASALGKTSLKMSLSLR
jgi:hypothetical protein